MNAYKNGSLEGLSIRNWIQNYTTAEGFVNNLNISD
jgi:hypothetical protein